MYDKNGVEIKVGDKILSKGKFEYKIITVEHDWAKGQMVANGLNLSHTDLLKNLDLSQVEIVTK